MLWTKMWDGQNDGCNDGQCKNNTPNQFKVYKNISFSQSKPWPLFIITKGTFGINSLIRDDLVTINYYAKLSCPSQLSLP